MTAPLYQEKGVIQVIALCLVILAPLSVHAKVAVNEVTWMGSPVVSVDVSQWWRYEWVELFNDNPSSVDLSGWRLGIADIKGNEKSIPLGGNMQGNGYVVVASSKEVPRPGVVYQNLGGLLRNDGGRISVYNASGAVEDWVDALDGWPAGNKEEFLTMELGDEWHDSEVVGGSPGAKNSSGVVKALSSIPKGVTVFSQQKTPLRELSLIRSSPMIPACVGALLLGIGTMWIVRRVPGLGRKLNEDSFDDLPD